MEYLIYVRNLSPLLNNFIIFQAPAVCSGNVVVHSNNLFNFTAGEGMGCVAIAAQPLVGAQLQVSPLVIGQPSGGTVITSQINLTEGASPPIGNTTELTTNPLGFSPVQSVAGVPPNAFRVVAPPQETGAINVGLGCAGSASYVLSSFWEAQANQIVDCQPVLIFYVAAGGLGYVPFGGIAPGTLIDFAQSITYAQICDFSKGETAFTVTCLGFNEWNISAGTPF